MPEIHPGNIDAWNLWQAVETQWNLVAGMGGGALIGLNYPAMYQVAGSLEIEISACLLAKIKCLEGHLVGKQFKKEKRDTAEK